MTAEGLAPFRDYKTWYRITGDLKSGKPPLFVLHGGPGCTHDYVDSYKLVADSGRAVIHYDQIGNGKSTHLPDKGGDFWTPEFFVAELENLIDHLGVRPAYHVLGQSWGGMLGAEIAVRQPDGLESLSICNSPASMQLWLQGAAELREQLPPEMLAAMLRHEADDTVDDPAYIEATLEFYRRHVCRVTPMPKDFADSEAQMIAEPTVYHTMNGPNEFHVIGTLRDWSIIERLPAITAPVLVVAGEFDEATPATWQPYVDHIADVRSHVFPDSSHCTHLEKPEEFRAVIAAFLHEHDLAAAARV